jgi:hypothetical protein
MKKQRMAVQTIKMSTKRKYRHCNGKLNRSAVLEK